MFTKSNRLSLALLFISVYSRESFLLQVFECSNITSKFNESRSRNNSQRSMGHRCNEMLVIRKEENLNLTTDEICDVPSERPVQDRTIKNACSISISWNSTSLVWSKRSCGKLQCCSFNDTSPVGLLLFSLLNCTSSSNRNLHRFNLSCVSRTINISSMSISSKTLCSGKSYKLYQPKLAGPSSIPATTSNTTRSNKIMTDSSPDKFILFDKPYSIILIALIILVVLVIVIGCWCKAKRNACTDLQLVTTPTPTSPNTPPLTIHHQVEDIYTNPDEFNSAGSDGDDQGEYSYAYAHPIGYRDKNQEHVYVNVTEAKCGAYEERRPSVVDRVEESGELKNIYTSLNRTEDAENEDDSMYQSLTNSRSSSVNYVDVL